MRTDRYILFILLLTFFFVLTSCTQTGALGDAPPPLPPSVSCQPAQTPTSEQFDWSIHIDDGFDSELTVPNAGFTYMTNTHIVLDAQKDGGESLAGDYTGTLSIETSIDEQSFIDAMKKIGAEDVTNMNSFVDIKTSEIEFAIVPYDHDEFAAANAVYQAAGGAPMVVPLTQCQGMAIASYTPEASQSVSITAAEGFGFGFGSGGEETPLLIQINSSGVVTAYFPRMLAFGMRNYFVGELAQMPIE